jgi:hypothetical protein
MLTLTIYSVELYDETLNIFSRTREQVLTLEHSLVSLSKWESTWNKPFLTKKDLTKEETIDYIRCMTITQNVDPNCYLYINQKFIDAVAEYIDRPMTATTFPKENGGSSRQIITSELIYYWMIAFQIPFSCEKWHLNRLLTLIKVCNIKANQSNKKLSAKEIASRNRQLNNARRQQLGTSG